ncbi:MAG: putative acyl-CoA thioesterase [Pseudonocardiales bacterium]|nr:putative acyl-CoA thioesterase [Pseudonocardiales bacterium]
MHSLHGYFLRPGDPRKQVIFEVHRDRDGRSYSARRVIARQGGKVIFNMATSFHIPENGIDAQAATMPDVQVPVTRLGGRLATRVFDVDFRDPEPSTVHPFPAQVWARVEVDLGDDRHLHACALTYVSDMFSGLMSLAPGAKPVGLTSLDHAIWFYRPVKMDEWVLMDLIGESVHSGRGLYSGRIFTADGVLVAGLAQESLFRVTVPSTEHLQSIEHL